MRKLAGKNVFVTGVTGFLGQAVFERLLLDFPDTRITLLVRPQLGSSGRQRVESLMGRPTFNALRDKVGTEGIAAALEERVDVVDGDFSADGLEIPGGLDVVIHCAATVAFDPPIDEGFLTNLVGAVRLYEAALASNPATHLLHVSTAYVAGVAQGRDPRGDARPPRELAGRVRPARSGPGPTSRPRAASPRSSTRSCARRVRSTGAPARSRWPTTRRSAARPG